MNNSEIGELPFLPGMPLDGMDEWRTWSDRMGHLLDVYEDAMIDNAYIIHERKDEWTESAENEPEEWREEKGDEQCASIFEQVAQARLEKPRGHCVREPHPDGSVWDV